MKKQDLEKLINISLTTGADFSELFLEDTHKRTLILTDSKLDKINNNITKGIGIRLAKDEEVLYSATNNLSYSNILKNINNLKSAFNSKQTIKNVALKDKYINKNNIDFDYGYNDYTKKEILLKIDNIARSYSSKVEQVQASLFEEEQNIEIANSKGEYSKDKRYLFRLTIHLYVKDKDKRDHTYEVYGNSSGYNFFDNFNLEKEVKRLVDVALEKLDAIPCPSGDMPVVIGPAFGAVIIHEACGHSLEATSVSKNISVLSHKLNKKVANDKVTIIDDGTIPNEWGSTYLDDEGNLTRKNTLIKDGVLVAYLVDELNNRTMNLKVNGCARRESYLFAPTSRMNNTYLEKGNDKISDMIKSIDYGLYAKTMNGGSVDPNTGDFNFGVREAYLIEKGKITKMVKGASLIGNTIDILQRIEMISDNLELGTGYCGSISGNIPVTCGQPTIKVSKILVGGDNLAK